MGEEEERLSCRAVVEMSSGLRAVFAAFPFLPG